MQILAKKNLVGILSFAILLFTIMAFVSQIDGNNHNLEEEDEQQISLIPQKNKLPTLMVKGETKSVPIQLNELKISAHVVGNIAITTMDMVFYNDSNRVLSGELYFPLSEGQTVSRFALEVNGSMRDAVVVEKAKGRIVFEKMVRRGIDPGLVELTKGNNFKTRIYPIPAKGTKRVIVSYEQELINNSSDIYYQLPLFFDEKVKFFELNVEVEGAKLPKINKGQLDNFQFEQWNEVYRASFKEKNFMANQELIIKIPQSPSGYNMVTEKAANGDHYFMCNMHPKLFSQEKVLPKSICIIWDVSNSGLSRNVDKEINLIRKYLATLTQPRVRLITFNNTVEHDRVYTDMDKFLKMIKNLSYDGGTQLGIIPFKSIKEEEVLLVSDAIHTIGNEDFELPSAPVYILNSSAGADYAIQQYIAGSTGGYTINLSKFTEDQAIEQLQNNSYQFISSEVVEGNAIEIYPKINQKVTRDFTVTGILKSSTCKLKLNFGFGNKVVWSKIIEIDPAKSYQSNDLASRLWAEKKLAELTIQYEKNKEEITALGKAYSIVTKNTSLIVLDDVQDYVENEIVPPKELMKEYNKLISQKNTANQEREQEKLASVIENWQSRVAWWNKTFEIPKTYDWTETSGSTGATDSISLRGARNSSTATYINGVRIQSTQNLEISTHEVEAEDSWGDDDGDDGANYFSTMPEESMNQEIEAVEVHRNNRRLIRSDNEEALEEMSSVAQPEPVAMEIELKEWNPDNEMYKKLDSQTAENCYATYLKLKSEETKQPTFYADAGTVLYKKGKTKEAIKVLSNLAELEFENHELLKVLGNKLMEWKEYDLAALVFKEILKQREEEPQSYRDLGLALHKQGKDQEAIEMLYQVVEKDWNERFPQIENIVLGEINSIVANSKKKLNTDFMHDSLKHHLPTDIRIIIDWDADNVDIDLWVTDPTGEKCFYSHPDTKIGGHMSKDFTRGYGPEEFLLKKAMKGIYKIQVNYYGTSQQRVAGPPTIRARLITNYGKENEEEKEITLRLSQAKEVIYIGELVI